ncbi:hypothetical protein ACIQ34_08315 [Ureibacillus sp. NPDC094379]
MSIVNPQYAFLEDDYKNPNLSKVIPDDPSPGLTQVKSEVENIGEEVSKDDEHRSGAKSALKNSLLATYLQVNWKLGTLLWIPADIFCIAYLVLVEIFS